MAVVEELIRVENENGLSFGDYTLNAKKKVSDFEFHGDMYKVKTYRDITKLEKNELFVYESVPGTSVFDFEETDARTEFEVEGFEDTQITLELEAEQEYEVFVDDVNIGRMTTNLGGKLVLSVELGSTQKHVKIVKM
ncbi:endosialidase [Coprococcus catus]|uniref:endosialidase n=1 Tax=Coprococcus catus TaxID=116085 RepID=UPI001C0307AD|nr:endosialidase [Coprococcus catus]MBT9774070.1 endosialidase [Coprococcus catus]MBX9232105.1 endosialidase [Coprococcus catus]MCT6801028.1 endosialidase [Coprococcus catus]MEE0141353.1 endosialidase [Coprococcus sp.]